MKTTYFGQKSAHGTFLWGMFLIVFSATFFGCQKNNPPAELTDHPVVPAYSPEFADSLQQKLIEASYLLSYGLSDSALSIYESLIGTCREKKIWGIYAQANASAAAIFMEKELYEYGLFTFLFPAHDSLIKHQPDNHAALLLLQAALINGLAETARPLKAMESILSMDTVVRMRIKNLTYMSDTTQNPEFKQRIAYQILNARWTHYHTVSLAYLAVGKTDSAEKYLHLLDKPLNLLISIDPNNLMPQLYPAYLSNIGLLHENRGNLDSAEYYYNQSLSLARQLGNIESAEVDLYNLGIISRKRKKPAEAIGRFEQSIDITRQKADPGDRSDVLTYLQLARCWHEIGEKQKAIDHIQQAISLQSLNYPSESAFDTNPSPSEILHDLQSVEALYLKALYLAEDCFTKLNYQHCLSAEATIDITAEIISELKHSLNTSELALSIVDSLWRIDFFAKEETEFSLADSASALYENAVKVAFLLAELEPDRADFYHNEAWKYSEANKYNLLFYGIQRGEVKRFGKVPADSIIRERILAENLSRLETEVFTRKQAGENEPKVTELTSTKAAWSSLEKYYQQTFPDYYELRFGKNNIPVSIVQQQLLKKNEALLEYLTTDDAIYAFLITPDTMVTFQTCGVTDSLIAKFRRGVAMHPDSSEKSWKYSHIAVTGHKLYSELLQPAIHVLKNISDQPCRLQIARDGNLNFLNFNAFLQSLPKPNEESVTPWEYVVLDEKIIINYQYSAGIAFRESLRKKDTKFIADYGGFAPWPQLKELVYSKKAVEAIGAKWGISSQTYTTPDDPKYLMKTFLEKGPQFKICHITTHGRTDPTDPALSRLMFSEQDSLPAQTIYEYSFPNEQIVLDACETGVGKHAAGEGILSLDRAFTFAGAHSVMMSLWKVEDAAAGILMEGYFENLKEGLSRDQAWKRAQMQYVRSEGEHYPYYWAASVSIGDYSPMTFSSSFGYGYVLLGLVIGVLFVLFFYRKRNK
ncbi:MAG: CHAT domain-containing tetratricopeptide repeat protein [Bacteroidia bacterium]|nr:CHAT domain-containing tetratricopeptide repeat protein [Bacteroidia bacterium]